MRVFSLYSDDCEVARAAARLCSPTLGPDFLLLNE
jgi:hypothetical protein